METALRLLSVILLLGVFISVGACGGHSDPPASNSLAGNWQVTLNGGTSTAIVLTGFLTQSGSSVTGSIVLPLTSGCSGVGGVSGTGTGQNLSGAVNGQNVSLNLNESGAVIGFTGAAASSGTGATMSGNFTAQPGTCALPSAGTWSAIQIVPISGGFHGSFKSTSGNVVTVTGTLNEGPNTGNSTAVLSGTLATTSAPTLCSYLFPGTITGLISGTEVQLNLFGENGLQYAQLGLLTQGGATVSPDGTSLSGSYNLPGGVGSACQGSDQGTFSLSFP